MRVTMAAVVVILHALIAGACSQAGITAPTAPVVDIAVSVYDRESQSPLAHAHIHALPDFHTDTDEHGRAVVPAIVGADVVITASAPGYVPMTVRGRLSNPYERWGFFLERMR